MLTFGSLFAGIGGFDLGFERAGMECRWQVEIDPYCSRVLAKHWPNVRRWDDVRTWPQPDTERVDVICGGSPCQDISDAGKRVGIGGRRSGLWSEFSRIIRELRPRFVVVENVVGLLTRGFDIVLGALAALGYDAEWDVLAASDFGAPHIRERIFIIAYPKAMLWKTIVWNELHGILHKAFSYANCCDKSWNVCEHKERAPGSATRYFGTGRGAWHTEPHLDRVAYGVPKRVDRLRGLGNAVVPQVAEWIGRRIVENDARNRLP